MAILDVASLLSNNQAITVTAPSTAVYDTAGLGVGQPVLNIFGNATTDSSFGQDMGDGGPLVSGPQVAAYVGTAFAAGGAATLQVQLQAAVDTNNSGTPGTWQTILETDAYALATLTAGQKIADFTVPKRYPGQNFPRFYRLNYVVATGPMTAGTIAWAGLLTGTDENPLYPAAY
jgi:hypothetical protein